jgi:hypothetical protein
LTKKKWAIFTVIALGIFTAACETPLVIDELTCNDIIDDVVSLSQDQAEGSAFQSGILKIYDSKQVSQMDKRLTCEGRTLLDSGDEQGLEFFAFVDEDRDSFIGFEGK